MRFVKPAHCMSNNMVAIRGFKAWYLQEGSGKFPTMKNW